MQRARLVRVTKHLHHSREVMMRQVAAEAGVGLRQHLRRLKALCFAEQDLFHVCGNDCGLLVAVDVIVAAGLECLHQRPLASISERDNRKVGVFQVRVNDFRHLQSAHLPHFCRAQDGAWRVIFERSQGESRLRAGCHFESFAFQRVAKALREIDVAVDEQNLDWKCAGAHGRASGLDGATTSASISCGPGVKVSRFKTSMTSPSCDSQPATCGASDSPAAITSALISSHSPETGTATHSLCVPYCRAVIK